MNNHLVFATGRMDAMAKCQELGIEFDETVWVLNYQLLGTGDYSNHIVHYTELFKEMPAYAEALRELGDEDNA